MRKKTSASGTASERQRTDGAMVSEKRERMGDKPDIAADELARRRRNARRTAIILGLIALAIFVTFFMTGVTGRGQ